MTDRQVLTKNEAIRSLPDWAKTAIMTVRDLLVLRSYDEAYHQLYIAFTPQFCYQPWRAIEGTVCECTTCIGNKPPENEPCEQLPPCPFPALDGTSVDGKHLGPNVWGIGTVSWHPETQDWRCLADVQGCLCSVVVKVTAQPQKSEGASRDASSGDFDKDLARLDGIRKTMADMRRYSLQGVPQGEVQFLLSFIDNLWREHGRSQRTLE